MQGRRFFLAALILLFSLGSRAQTPVVTLEPGPVQLTRFSMSYFVDPSGQMPFEQVRQQRFTASANKLSLGTGAKTTWARIELHNPEPQARRLFLHHPYAYHNALVALYETRNGRWQQQRLDLDQAENSPLMFRGSAVFEFQLPANSRKTLYVHSQSFSHQWFSLLILDEQHSRRELTGSHTDIALMVGMLLALVIYNGLLFYSSSKKENIFYSLYLISGGIWIALSYGLLANLFGLYGSQVLPLHLSLLTMPILLILFMMHIFRTGSRHPKEHRWLQLMLALLLLDLAYGVFDILGALRPASTLAGLMMLVTFSVCISLMRKGDTLAKYFLIGHSLFVLFSTIAVLFYKGLIEFNYLTSHGVGIGIMLESLMLAFIIAYRIRILEQIKLAQKELRLQALTDPMTQLYNRRYFYTEAAYQWQQARDSGQPLALMMLDIDHFKQVNDRHGHQTGDAVIIALAALIRQQLQPGQLAARFGGEEFVILLPQCSLQAATEQAEQLRLAAENCRPEAAAGLSFTISIGVTEVDAREETPETALNLADIALYDAKNSGRNRVRPACKPLTPVAATGQAG